MDFSTAPRLDESLRPCGGPSPRSAGDFLKEKFNSKSLNRSTMSEVWLSERSLQEQSSASCITFRQRETGFAMSVRHATTAKYEQMRVILAMRSDLHGARPGRKCTNSSAKVVQRHPKVKFEDLAFWKRFIRSPFTRQGNNVISHPETPARSQNTWGLYITV